MSINSALKAIQIRRGHQENHCLVGVAGLGIERLTYQLRRSVNLKDV